MNQGQRHRLSIRRKDPPAEYFIDDLAHAHIERKTSRDNPDYRLQA